MIEHLGEAISLISKSTDLRRKKSEATTMTAIHSFYQPKTRQITNCYYLLTPIPKIKEIPSSITLTETYSNINSNQLNLILLSKSMFANSKPLVGIELQAIYHAFEKQRAMDVDSML